MQGTPSNTSQQGRRLRRAGRALVFLVALVGALAPLRISLVTILYPGALTALFASFSTPSPAPLVAPTSPPDGPNLLVTPEAPIAAETNPPVAAEAAPPA